MPIFEPLLVDNPSEQTRKNRRLCLLTPDTIAMLEEALDALGEYGEVRLIVNKGQLRFIITSCSQKLAAE